MIEFELGRKAFERIEKIRRFVKSPATRNLKGLISLKDQLSKLSPDEQYQVAHAFALMLELINACEAAYRTHRLKIEDKDLPIRQHSYGRIIHVLTAHPTESRSPDIIFYFKKIQALLERRFEKESEQDTPELNALLKWAWNIPMSKQRKPTVMDEAEYIYSLALEKDIIEIYLKHRQAKHPFYIRTWVGGDKDGHPGVDEKTMLASLNMAREFLHRWLKEEVQSFLEDIKPLVRAANLNKQPISVFHKKANSLRPQLSKVRTIQN
ncbi:MAG: phosphoenolpyruvate carboxylase, partial [Bdellovibrio sp.]|nr:phosphoenolpyruvate carboxylase [Bdellovibrio sp.]